MWSFVGLILCRRPLAVWPEKGCSSAFRLKGSRKQRSAVCGACCRHRSSCGLVEAIGQHAEGNPFFVAETVRLLVQQGDIRRGEEPAKIRWSIHIPEGGEGVIGRRLDR